jgi:hypothetical protein
MDMVETGDNLSEDGRDEATSEMAAPAGFDEVIEITFHGFEDKV